MAWRQEPLVAIVLSCDPLDRLRITTLSIQVHQPSTHPPVKTAEKQPRGDQTDLEAESGVLFL